MLQRNMPIIRAPNRFRPEALFHPASVTVIGAASEAGQQVMANLMAGGFQGAVLPVGQGISAVSGVLAYPDVASLPIAPDLAVLCEGRPAELFPALAARGTHACIVIGMAEGVAGAVAATGVRAMGPGSFGISVPGIGLHATRSHLLPRPGRVALVSQSAALCRAVLDWAEPNGVGFSHVIGVGGNTDLGFAPVLDWLSRDPGTGAILLDIRHIRDRRMFLSAARAAARLRPVVAMRAGGQLADPTGAADAAFAAALRRAGVLSVARLEDLLAAAETLTRSRPARGDRLAIVTNAIGPAQMAADAVLRDGMHLAELTPETRAVIRMAVPSMFQHDIVQPGTTQDMLGDIVYVGTNNPMRLAETASLLAGAREVGGVLVMHAPTGEQDSLAIEALAAAARGMKVPLLVCAMGETTGASHRHTLAAAGVPAFASPEQAVRGFHHLVEDRRNRAAARELPPSTVLHLAPDLREVAALFNTARAETRLTLAQDEAMAVLAAYGIPTAPLRVAMSAADAADAADLLGYPVVLKRRRLDRAEHAARGRLMLDLRDAGQVRDAARMLGCAPLGFLVQRQAARARELLVRVQDDTTFGPTILFGQGGTAAAFVHDIAVDLPPLNLPLAHALIARTRVSRALAALHDLPEANVAAIADTLVRISQLVIDMPEIAELDINPIFVDACGVLVADAWIRLREAGAAPGRLAIPPYPGELVVPFEAAGERLTIRPIRPEDAEAHGAFFSRLSPEDVRYRFFSTMRELSPEQMARMTQVDYEREMAFVAVRETQDKIGEMRTETVGVARLVREGADTGEFAIVVQPDMKGRGLARHLMQRLIHWGRDQGLVTISGQILAENRPMLSFIRKLGFTIHHVPGEDDIVEARLTLG